MSFANVNGSLRGDAQIPDGMEQQPPAGAEVPPADRAEVLLGAGPGS
jgi:hypothetical protein